MEGCVLDLVASLDRKPDWDEAELWPRDEGKVLLEFGGYRIHQISN